MGGKIPILPVQKKTLANQEKNSLIKGKNLENTVAIMDGF